GDSDADGRHEIFAASGKKAVLFEFSDNSNTHILHTQKWISREYDREITEVSISDLNGNGFPELIIETSRGVVNSYEVIDTSMEQSTDIIMPKYQQSVYEAFVIDPLNEVRQILTQDITGDGTDDIIYSVNSGRLVALNGEDFSTIFNTGFPLYGSPGSTLNKDNVNYIDDYHFNDFYLIQNSSVAPSNILLIHRDTINLYSLLNGNLINSVNFTSLLGFTYLNNRIRSVQVLDYIEGGYQEIVVGLTRGITLVYSGNDLTELHRVDLNLSPTTEMQWLVKVGNFMDTTRKDFLLVISGGSIPITLILKNGVSGVTLWTKIIQSFGTISYPKSLVVSDLNQDALDDIFLVQFQFLTAFSGLSGDLIWNTTISDTNYYRSGTKDIPVRDIDEDGINDFIVSFTSKIMDKPIMRAISGHNGQSIWEQFPIFTTNNARSYYSPAIGDTQLFGGVNLLIVNSRQHPYNTEVNPYTALHDLKTGTIMGRMKTNFISDASAIFSKNGMDYAILGDKFGSINIYSLHDGIDNSSYTYPATVSEQPFFALGSEFTDRTQYVLRDVTSDGVDDVLVADDNYIGMGDTYNLLNDPNYNQVLWELNLHDVGRLLGRIQVAEIKQNGIPYLLAPFEYTFIAVNMQTGVIEWTYNYTYNEFGIWDNFDYLVSNFNPSVAGLEIIFTGQGQMTLGETTGYATILGMIGASNGNFIYSRDPYFGYQNPKFAFGNIDGASTLEVLFSMETTYNPFISVFGIFNASLIPFYADLMIGMPPIADILVGEFDSNFIGDEFILQFDFNEINYPHFPYQMNDFPSIFLLYAWDPADFLQPSRDKMIGISPVGENTRSFAVHSQYNPSTASTDRYLVGETISGDLFTLNMSSSPFFTNKYMDQSGVLDSNAAPYARHSVLYSTNICSRTSNEISFVKVMSITTIACYSNVNMNYVNDPVWTIDIDFDIVYDMIIGDFDTDAIDDLMIIGKNGYVWVMLSTLGLNVIEHEILILSDNNYSEGFATYGVSFVYISPILTILLAIYVIRRKFKK
ncbi:MAG: hypothetical protein OEZ01_12010, partial [Candidatus Heimdallarchaeota archaeon]|nr:hypothetical protein [Candidatus Heimdallarchaeota archaeon]